MDVLDSIVAISAILIVIGLPIGLGMYLGIRSESNKHKERMAMIERGLMPSVKEDSEDKHVKSLRRGFILSGIGVGLGIGLLIVYLLKLNEDNSVFVIGASVLTFTGLGYLLYHYFSNKNIKVEE